MLDQLVDKKGFVIAHEALFKLIFFYLSSLIIPVANKPFL